MATPPERETIIHVENFKAAYNGQVILDHINFEVYAGEVFAILGGSGSGKSTLLKHMIGLYKPAAGRILIDGEDIAAASGAARLKILRKFGVMYQSGALFGSMCKDERGRARVMAPEQKGIALRDVRRRDFNAERISETCILMPIAHVSRRNPVRASEAVEKTCEPAFGVRDRGSTTGPFGESDRARAKLIANTKQSLGDFVKRLFPADPLPSGIWISLWLCPLERIIQSIGMIHELGRRLALETKYSAVRMIMERYKAIPSISTI